MNRREVITQAKEILANCRSLAFDGKTPVYAPDAKSFYKGVYWRDFCYTVEGFGELLPLEDIELTIRYLLEPPLLKGKILHKSRSRDGQLTYNAQSPDEQPFSTPCSADNQMFAVKVVAEYIERGGKIGLFEQYARKLEGLMNDVLLSKDHLMEDTVGPHIYGFYDTICLTGEECFASVLFYDAALRLAMMFEKIGDEKKAELWKISAEKTRQGLKKLWIEKEGILLSDTGTNRQIDVWGSAFAVYVGAVSKEQAVQISNWFIRNYDRCIRWGHVRHLPSPEYWKGALKHIYPAIHPKGHYQNGGYWSVPSPWVVYTIGLTNKELAGKMVEDLEYALLKFKFPECINEDGSVKLPGYTASAAMGLLALKILGGLVF